MPLTTPTLSLSQPGIKCSGEYVAFFEHMPNVHLPQTR